MRLELTHYVKHWKNLLSTASRVNCTSEPVGNWFCQLGIPSIKGQSHEITTVTICVLYNKITKIFTSNYLHKITPAFLSAWNDCLHTGLESRPKRSKFANGFYYCLQPLVECEAHSRLGSECEAHSRLGSECEACSRLLYHCEARSHCIQSVRLTHIYIL